MGPESPELREVRLHGSYGIEVGWIVAEKYG